MLQKSRFESRLLYHPVSSGGAQSVSEPRPGDFSQFIFVKIFVYFIGNDNFEEMEVDLMKCEETQARQGKRRGTIEASSCLHMTILDSSNS